MRGFLAAPVKNENNLNCFISDLVNIMASKDQGQSLMTPEDEANWNREVEAQFQSTYSTAKSCRDKEVSHSRKRGEGTKLWTTGAQLADYKIPKLTRYARILQRWTI